MRHVQRLGNQGRSRTLAGALALVSGLALFSVARAPGAMGQLISADIDNSGGAVASTGGNTATGNASTNTIDSSSSGTSGGLLGGLVSVDLGLGAPTNTSTGNATVNSGPAAATGNQSQTGVTQTNTGGTTFTPFTPFGSPSGSAQTAEVSNTGDAVATSGGNTAVGNSSENTIESTQDAGAIDANIGLGGATNNSSGTAAITTGATSAAGNVASTAVNQTNVTDSGGGFGSGVGGGGFFGGGFGGGGFFHATPFHPGVFPGTVSGFGSNFDPCSGRFFPFSPFLNSPSVQAASVDNDGLAAASTGGNTAVGNASTNSAVVNQSASGGLIGLNINLGGPTNNSTGTATINTGPATAVGNQSSTSVSQSCGPAAAAGVGQGVQGPFARNVITGHPIVVPHIPPSVVVSPVFTTLARTGFESGMIVLAVSLVLFGMGMLYTARRRLSPAGRPAGGVSSTEWDTIVRW